MIPADALALAVDLDRLERKHGITAAEVAAQGGPRAWPDFLIAALARRLAELVNHSPAELDARSPGT